jgi:hypothetical protein
MIDPVQSGINDEGKFRYALIDLARLTRGGHSGMLARGWCVCRMGNNAMPEKVLPGIGEAFRP